MPMCPPCCRAADEGTETASVIVTGDGTPIRTVRGRGHDPAICRDAAIQPHGCPCAHRPVGTATPEGTTHA